MAAVMSVPTVVVRIVVVPVVMVVIGVVPMAITVVIAMIVVVVIVVIATVLLIDPVDYRRRRVVPWDVLRTERTIENPAGGSSRADYLRCWPAPLVVTTRTLSWIDNSCGRLVDLAVLRNAARCGWSSGPD